MPALRHRHLAETLALAALLFLGMFLTASAQAATSVALSFAPPTVSAGRMARVQARLSGAPQDCRLQLLYHGHARLSSAPITATREYLSWTWTVPINARSARWLLKVACARGSAQTEMRVSGHGRTLVLAHTLQSQRSGSALRTGAGSSGSGSSGDSGSGSSGDSGSGSSGDSGPGTSAGPGSGVTSLTSPVMCNGSDGPYCTFVTGGCEYHAYQMRPDIVNQEFLNNPDGHGLDWSAGYWAANAQQEGYPVDPIPQAGDVAVWTYDAGGIGPDGHVAYVESVDPSGDEGAGTALVSEMDFAGDPDVTERTIDDPSYGGILFIHHKP